MMFVFSRTTLVFLLLGLTLNTNAQQSSPAPAAAIGAETTLAPPDIIVRETRLSNQNKSISAPDYITEPSQDTQQIIEPEDQPSNDQLDNSQSAPELRSSANRVVQKAELACNDSSFVTNGAALLNQIRQHRVACIGRLFDDAEDSIRKGSFTQANILTVANEAKLEGIRYDGVDADIYLRKLHYWIRAFYYYKNKKLQDPENQQATKEAVDALISNSHFFDKTQLNGDVINFTLGANINNADIGVHYVPLIHRFLDIFDKSYNDIPDWRYAFANIFWSVMNQCAGDIECRATQHNAELVAKIGNFTYNNLSWLDKINADNHLHNLGYQLANFYAGSDDPDFGALQTELEYQLHRVFNEFGPDREDTARRAYLMALSGINARNKCAIYDLCSKKQEIIDLILDNRINCPTGTLEMWAQDMNQAQLEWACNSLGTQETTFHNTLQTNNIPVIPDDNDSLRMIVFNDSREWGIYGFVLFNTNTDNGGVYLEGDPSAPGDQATFFAYENVLERPIFDIWNLHHEYMHYLDGRFIKKGSFEQVRDAGRTTWYTEGIADYVSKQNCNDQAIEKAREGTHAISTIFQNEYGVSQDRIYRWGYLANRFMFEKHNNEFFSMLELFKQGQYATYRSTMVDPWITNQVFDAEFSDWLQTVQSDGCEVDTTRPPSPIEPIEIDDVQGDDQVGLDACSIGDRLVQPDNRIYAGKAVCLTDVSVDGAPLQLALHAPSGLVDVTLQITLRHGNGNPDLTHRYDARPSTTVFDHHSNGPGVEETILVRPVQQNWNYINVLPTGGFSGVTLLAKYIQNQAAITVPVPLTPSGIITTSQATFTWQEVPGAPAYAVVARNDEGAYFVNNSTGSITCPDGICTYSKPNTDFPNGNYTWYVRILNSDNSNGENSEALSFNVNTAAPSTPTPEITSPAPNAILTNSEQQFSWLSNESNVSQWRLTAGSVLGAEDYFESAVLPGPTNSVIVNGLPTDGGEVFVRLWYQQNNTWEFIDASYASLQSNNITPVSPLHNATNHSATTSFQWRNLNRQISANVTDWSYTVMVKDTNNNDKTIHFNAVSPTTRCDNSGCSFQRDLPSGDYKWQVGVYENYADGSYGYHLQTDFINFTVVNEE